MPCARWPTAAAAEARRRSAPSIGLAPGHAVESAVSFEQQLAALHNDRFEAEPLLGSVVGALNGAAVQTCGEGLSISDGDIHALVACRDQAQQIVADRFDKLILMARERQANLRLHQDVALLSLGFDCLGRTIPTRWGLRPPRRLGAVSGPFDLAVHMPEVVERLVLEGFPDYLDPAQLAFRPEHNFCVHTGFDISFNHERGPEFAENDFQLLREIYGRRVANFEAALLDPRPLLLVAHSPAFMGIYAGQVEGLRRVLRHVAERRSAPTRLVVIKTHNPGDRPGSCALDDDEMAVHILPLPREGYVWYEPQDFLSDEGFALERGMVRLVQEGIERLRGAASAAAPGPA